MNRNARIKAMKILYTMEVSNISANAAKDFVLEEKQDEYASKLVDGCLANLLKIDSLIMHNLVNYTIDRLNLVDKAIIRIAVYELLCGKPKEVVINEALEITKEYSDEGNHKATSFNNSVLDKIAKSLE